MTALPAADSATEGSFADASFADGAREQVVSLDPFTVRRWFDADGVEAILEVVTTGPTVATIAVARQRGKVVITNGEAESSCRLSG